ncbi:MAG: solanesyl diphosphate synthase [Cyanobacteria bacterium PR.3.49]|nr:solanesyl diphosphate synthase [Cyanobacteria bacterium PR.3.49]
MTSASITTATPLQDDLKAIIAPVKEELAIVETWLTTNLIDDNPFVGELLSQVFQSGGKRIRVAIALLGSKASLIEGREIGRLNIIQAVLTELIHTASLVHDDVIDSASLRRGKETVNKRFNDRLAVLLGDLLFAQASICLARIMNPVVVGIYGQVLGDLCAGEIKQMRSQFNVEVNWEGYINKSIGKTASLFAAGAHAGAILNAAPDLVVQSLKDYGVNLGICFQIVDDLLDVTGEATELGKQPGSDLRAGVVTAPALFILEKDDAAAKRLRELIKTRAIATDEGSEEGISIIKSEGGVEATVNLAGHYANLAKESLSKIAPSDARNSLESLINYVLVRTK